jgi:hypothetical protein
MDRDVEYHLHRARSERDIAYRAAIECVSDAHMRLSALHLGRALLLQDVQRPPVGNVTPFRSASDRQPTPGTAAACNGLVELPSSLVSA